MNSSHFRRSPFHGRSASAPGEATTLWLAVALLLIPPLPEALAASQAAVLATRAAPVSLPPRPEDFTFLYWAEGPPYYHDMKDANPPALLCLESGSLGMALDTRNLALLHAGRLAAALGRADMVTSGYEKLRALPSQELFLAVEVDGGRYRCIGQGEPSKDRFHYPVRFIESGRFLQRVTLENLEFMDAAGRVLPAQGRLELALWPDRLILACQMAGGHRLEQGRLVAAYGNQRAAVTLQENRPAVLELFAPTTAAPAVQTGPNANAAWNPQLGAWQIGLSVPPWRNAKGTYYPEEELDRLDRWSFTLQNDTDRETVAPLVFVPDRTPAITGMTPLLGDPDGTPTGLPVQVSKNWHAQPEKGELPHQGPWFHACAYVRVPAQSTRELVFTLTYARWGGVPAASHAQLCLVGWGHNQFWDEAALGSFGESICYEPGRVQRRCFITDIRPFMTLPEPEAKPYGWARNGGGGDFLMWIDEGGRYRGFRRTRTDYRSHGPCRTDVVYTEETSQGEIGARVEVSLVRSDDYVRAFHRLRYKVRHPVHWQRLAFFQLGADFYNETPSRRVAVGDQAEMREEWEPVLGKDRHDRAAIELKGKDPWISVHGLEAGRLGPGQAAASKGLIVRSWKAVLGGRPSSLPYAATYATEWGKDNCKTVVELVPPPGINELVPGDFVEADLELVMFPTDAAAYYGPNLTFRRVLEEAADTWRLVQREAAGNALDLRIELGTRQRTYPMELAVDTNQQARLRLQGGIGYVPITFTGLRHYRGYTLYEGDKAIDQSVHGHDFWQTDHDPGSATWELTFNVALDGQTRVLTLQPDPQTN